MNPIVLDAPDDGSGRSLVEFPADAGDAPIGAVILREHDGHQGDSVSVTPLSACAMDRLTCEWIARRQQEGDELRAKITAALADLTWYYAQDADGERIAERAPHFGGRDVPPTRRIPTAEARRLHQATVDMLDGQVTAIEALIACVDRALILPAPEPPTQR
jgi:hypothetical protein